MTTRLAFLSLGSLGIQHSGCESDYGYNYRLLEHNIKKIDVKQYHIILLPYITKTLFIALFGAG